ncbi:hypothetical protein Tco_0517736 [Tanacetum coccineum]
MAQVSIVKKASIFAIVALSVVAAVSAQVTAPAPSPDAGAAFSVSITKEDPIMTPEDWTGKPAPVIRPCAGGLEQEQTPEPTQLCHLHNAIRNIFFPKGSL